MIHWSKIVARFTSQLPTTQALLSTTINTCDGNWTQTQVTQQVGQIPNFSNPKWHLRLTFELCISIYPTYHFPVIEIASLQLTASCEKGAIPCKMVETSKLPIPSGFETNAHVAEHIVPWFQSSDSEQSNNMLPALVLSENINEKTTTTKKPTSWPFLHGIVGPNVRFFETWFSLSLPRVINVKFLLQPHQKYYITQYEELGIS